MLLETHFAVSALQFLLKEFLVVAGGLQLLFFDFEVHRQTDDLVFKLCSLLIGDIHQQGLRLLQLCLKFGVLAFQI